MMGELRDALDSKLKLGLKADARVDSEGTLYGRVFIENVSFGAEFTLVQVKDWSSGPEGEECEVSVRSQLLPKVNGLGRYFPFTASNRAVREVDRIAKETISKSLGKSVSIVVDNTIGIGAVYLVGAMGILGSLFGGIYEYLFTVSENAGLEAAAVGGAAGAAVMVALIFSSVG